MIINCAYYPDQCAKNSPTVLEAFLHSLKVAGITPVENSLDCDAVVIWSVLWNGRMQANKAVYEHYRSQHKPVIVIDVGALKREITWKISVNNINSDGYYGHQQNLDWDRPAQLELQLHDMSHKREDILLAMQHRKSLQWHNMPEPVEWVKQYVNKIRQYTDRHIVIRPHPRSPVFIPRHRFGMLNLDNCSLEEPMRINDTYDQYDIDYEYHIVVNHCSGPGIKAAIDGANVLVDKSSLAYPVSTRLEYIENPPLQDREQWFVEICHTEYTVEEIEQGLWLKRLSDSLE